MGLLIVDESKCKKDGICARECPTAIIHQKKGESYPRLAPGVEPFCIRCGHCVAVCPHGALSHAEVPLERCPPIIKERVIGEEQAVQFLRSRRSIRFFKDRPVEKETIQGLIETARYAPTASNGQPVVWQVFTDRDRIRELAEAPVAWMRTVLKENPGGAAPYLPLLVSAWDAGYDAVLRGAPALVAASAPREARSGMVDVSLALSYLELAATAAGLGTCWAGLLQGAILASPALKQAVGIPNGHPHHYPLMLGYPKARYFRLPERRAPRITWR